MQAFNHCSEAIDACARSRRFAVAYLRSDEKPRSMHIHDCLEMYYSMAGDRQFVVEDSLYDARPGDLFVMNPFEAHRPVCAGDGAHERIVVCIHPEYLRALSTPQTDLSACFYRRPPGFCHRARLDGSERAAFTLLLQRLNAPQGFGSDLLENGVFAELMVLVNSLYFDRSAQLDLPGSRRGDGRAADILAFLNAHITQPVSIDAVAEAFYLSRGYVCRLFKEATGTTINKYVVARRISVAKRLLAQGYSVHEACEQSGFGDYAHFIRAFGQAVGVSPKQYALISRRPHVEDERMEI